MCVLGAEDADLRAELLTRETAREALSTYEVTQPFADSVAVETVSLGAAVSLLNDLNWYLVRYARDALVLEPSVSDEEWLSRDLATAVRDSETDHRETGRYLKLYGVVEPGGPEDDGEDRPPAGPPELVEPLFVQRFDGSVPEYDLREVDDTLVVRVTGAEYGG